jgi:hypothetical protein
MTITKPTVAEKVLGYSACLSGHYSPAVTFIA